MAKPSRGIRALILTTIVLCITISLTGAWAGQEKNGTLRVALVDIERVSTEFAANLKAVQDIQKQQQTNGAILQTLAQNALLPEPDHTALSALITTENATPNGLNDAQKQQKQKLLDKHRGLVEDFNALQQKVVGQLNDLDKQKLNDYVKAQNDARQRLGTLEQKMEADLQNMVDQNRKKALKNVRDAIAKVARDKGFSLVLSNEIAWYAENDLTEDVIKTLNKK